MPLQARRAGRPQRPVDPGNGPGQQLAIALRKLREDSGSPTYRVMAGRVHYSASALARAASGTELPGRDLVLAYVRACGGDQAEWEQRWAAAADAAAGGGECDAAPAPTAALPAAAGPDGPAPAAAAPAVPGDARALAAGSPRRAVTRRRRAVRARGAVVPLGLAVVIAGVAVLVLEKDRSRDSASPDHLRGVPAASSSIRPGGGPPDATGARAATPPAPAATAVSWSAFSGPVCASSGAKELAFYSAPQAPAPWHATAVSGPSGYGCADPQYTSLSGSTTSWNNDADWVFTPGRAVTACRFRIYIPRGTWSGSAAYRAYPDDESDGANGQAIATFTVDQAADAGGWADSPQITFSTGTIDLEITDEGAAAQPGAVADVVLAACS
jgi:hypothetical protein